MYPISVNHVVRNETTFQKYLSKLYDFTSVCSETPISFSSGGSSSIARLIIPTLYKIIHD